MSLDPTRNSRKEKKNGESEVEDDKNKKEWGCYLLPSNAYLTDRGMVTLPVKTLRKTCIEF